MSKDWYDSIGTSYENSSSREIPTRKHRERIHRESPQLDKKNLPFTFGKPSRSSTGIRDVYVLCSQGHPKAVTKTIVSYVCRDCQEYVKVTEENTFSNTDDPGQIE